MSEAEALKIVANLMCLAARTAPKTRGVDVILTRVADEADRARLADEMERIAQTENQAFFLRDANNLRAAGACVLVAATAKPAGLKVCGTCGFESCAACTQAGAVCAFNHIDLGIAAASANILCAFRTAIPNALTHTKNTYGNMILPSCAIAATRGHTAAVESQAIRPTPAADTAASTTSSSPNILPASL